MAKRKSQRGRARASTAARSVGATADELLLAALESGGDPTKTGRLLMTFKEGAADAAMRSLRTRSGLRMASARDFKDQAVNFAETGDAEGIVFPEIGVALVSGEAAASRAMYTSSLAAEDSPVASVDPEFFMFALDTADYLRGFLAATRAISADLGGAAPAPGAE